MRKRKNREFSHRFRRRRGGRRLATPPQGRAVGDAGAVGHTGRMRLTRPSGHANAGRRGCRPLRVGAKRRYQHRGKQLRKGNHLHPPLGSPERGAVAALCAVTEGLVQRGCGAITLQVNPRISPQGRASTPARRRLTDNVGAPVKNGARAVPAGLHTWGGKRYRAHRIKRGRNRSCPTSAANLSRRSHDRGAPRTVRPTGNCVSNVAVHNVTCTENHTHTARPLHGSAETLPIATTVGGGVLDAPSAG